VPDRFQPLDVAVVGGGISGLACAFWLKQRGHSLLLLEATPHVGGCIQSLRTGAYVADGGPQSFLASPELLELVRESKVDDFMERADPHAARPYLFHDGRLVTVPQQPKELLATPLLSFAAKLRLFDELFMAKRSALSDESIASFVRRHAGSEVLESVVDPFVGGIFAGDTTKLSVASVFPAAVELERQHGSVIKGALAKMRGARRAVAESASAKAGAAQSSKQSQSQRRATIGFRGGNDVLPKVLAHHLGTDVRTNTPVKAIWQRGEWLELLLDDASQTRIVSRAIVLATPAAAAGSLLKLFSPRLSGQLSAIGSPPVVQIALAYPRDTIGVELAGFGFLASRKEKLRMLGCVFNSVMFPDRSPKDQVLFTAFLGGATDPQIYDFNDADLARLAHADLQRVLKIRTAMPSVIAGFRWPQAIPQYNLGHGERVRTIERGVADIPNLYVCGNYLHGPSVSDCIKLAKSVASSVSTALAKPRVSAAASSS
jgi:oxygen-dependent protoporphyrinogen oxidase